MIQNTIELEEKSRLQHGEVNLVISLKIRVQTEPTEGNILAMAEMDATNMTNYIAKSKYQPKTCLFLLSFQNSGLLAHQSQLP